MILFKNKNLFSVCKNERWIMNWFLSFAFLLKLLTANRPPSNLKQRIIYIVRIFYLWQVSSISNYPIISQSPALSSWPSGSIDFDHTSVKRKKNFTITLERIYNLLNSTKILIDSVRSVSACKQSYLTSLIDTNSWKVLSYWAQLKNCLKAYVLASPYIASWVVLLNTLFRNVCALDIWVGGTQWLCVFSKGWWCWIYK